jgi:stringent starvation protein B
MADGCLPGGVSLLARLDDQVTDDFLRDAEAAFQVRDLAGVQLDLTDDVVAFEVALDGVGETAAAPVVDVYDLAASGGHALIEALQAIADDVIADFRVEDDNKFVVAKSQGQDDLLRFRV